MKRKKILIYIIALIAIALLSIPIYYTFHFGLKEGTEISSLISVAATCFSGICAFYAVVVALFGQALKDLLFSEEVRVSIAPDPLKEKYVSSAEENVVVDCYYCEVILTNIGVSTIKNCTLNIEDISYRLDNNKRYKSIFNASFDNKIVKHPSNSVVSLMRKQQITWPILYIHSASTLMQPDGQSPQTTKQRLEIIGHNLKNNQDSKGQWKIKYSIQIADKRLKNFEVELNWSGEWHQRAMEMGNEITIKIK